MAEAIPFLLKELNEHKEEIAEGEVGGLLDHIYGYKKIRDYTLVCWCLFLHNLDS